MSFLYRISLLFLRRVATISYNELIQTDHLSEASPSLSETLNTSVSIRATLVQLPTYGESQYCLHSYNRACLERKQLYAVAQNMEPLTRRGGTPVPYQAEHVHDPKDVS